MAQAAALIPGFTYEVRNGPRTGERVTIVNNVTFPDNHPMRRKVTIRDENGDIDYMIPRLLADMPIITAEPVEPIDWTRQVEWPAGPAAPADAGLTLPDTMLPVEPLPVSKAVERAVAVMATITDPMDDRLDIYRPSATKVKKYIKRIMPNGMTDVDFLLQFTSDAYRAENEGRPANVMLKGDTQGGKTFLVEVVAVAWAVKLGLPKPMPIFTLSGSSGVTDFDLFGQTTSYTDPMTDEDRLVWLAGLVDLASRVGGVLYLDEVNAMGERVTSSLHPVVDHRHAFINRNKAVSTGDGNFMPDVVSCSLDLWVLGTYNPGYRGMGEMNEAFSARFRHIPWGYDEKVERKLVSSPTIHLLADACRQARNANRLRTPVGTVALTRLQLDITTFGVAAGLDVFVGSFKPNEYDTVRAIITDRSIEVLLNDEVGADKVPDPYSNVPTPDPTAVV